MGFQAGLSESQGLLHVLDFFFRKDAIKEHSFDIVLLEVLVKSGCHMKDNVKRFQLSCGRCHFTEVSPPYLLEAFCHPLNFEACRISNLIMFQVADELTAQNAAVSGNFGARDEFEHFHVVEAGKFSFSSL